MTQKLELADKNFKISILNIFRDLKDNTVIMNKQIKILVKKLKT